MASTKVAAAAAILAVLTIWLATDRSGAAVEDRTLSIYNIHTKETVTATFKRGGRYDQQALADLNHNLRDWRVDKVTDIDPELFDLLWALHTELGSKGPIHLISGHRSAETNNMLRRTRGGQAKRSLHIQGQAADVFFPDVPLKRLRNAALVRKVGGVGYYPRSGQPFVHVDTGRVRHWPRIPEAQLAQIIRDGGSDFLSVPTTRVREVQIASTDIDIPVSSPRAKPIRSTAEPAPTRLRLAAAIFPTRDGDEQPARLRTAEKADAAIVQPRSWGQSLLLPSGAVTRAPRQQLAPQQATGSSRIVIADAAPLLTKADAPLSAQVFAGYAAPTVDRQHDQIAGLVDSAAGGLRTFIEEADRIQDRVTATARRAVGNPIDLRPAALSAIRDNNAHQRLLPSPIMTASLGAATTERFALERRNDAEPAPATVYMPAPHAVLDSGPALISQLLSDPATEHEVTFTRVAPIYASLGSFTKSDGQTFGMAPRAGNRGYVASFIDATRQAVSWIFGN